MKYILIPLAAFCLQACSKNMYETGTLTPHRAQVAQEQYYQKLDVSELHSLSTAQLADHAMRYGDGHVRLVGFVDPKTGGAVRARVTDFAAALRREGLRVQTEFLPMKDQSTLAVTYNYMVARGPRDCEPMAGYSHTDIGNNRNYKMGCTVETLIARQVANPRDLLGQSYDTIESDGRSAANIVNTYRSGAQNEPLGGFTASDE